MKELASLQRLDLRDTRITDQALVHLNQLTNLSALCLQGTLITDAGLAHLIGHMPRP
jgi:hypothetical protein